MNSTVSFCLTCICFYLLVLVLVFACECVSYLYHGLATIFLNMLIAR